MSPFFFNTYDGENYLVEDQSKNDWKRTQSKYEKFSTNFKVSSKEQKSLEYYLGAGFSSIRQYINRVSKQEKPSGPMVEYTKGVIKDVSGLIEKNKIDHDIVLSRRIDINGVWAPEAVNRFMSLKEGDVYEEESFASYSMAQLSDFGEFQVTLLAKKGQNIANIQGLEGEFEYLANKNTKYRVIGRGFNSVVVEMVD